MEVELVYVAAVPLGLVSSTLLYGASSKSEEQPSSQAAEVLVALCSTGRLVAFIAAYKAQFVVADAPLFHKGRLSEGVSYKTSYEGLLQVVRDPSQPRPVATSVIVIPITFERSGSTQRSSIVVVGFSDGHVRGYSKSGVCVLSQLLHSEPVARLTCMTPLSKTTPTQSNLVVLLKSVVCVIEGDSLVEVVRTNVAAMTHDGGTSDNEEGGTHTLAYRKWHLLDQSSTVDVALLAHSTPSAYDHLCEASSVGGFETVIRTGPTPEARLITVGAQPMIALYKITKDAGQLNMSEVVSAVASKMTTAVLGKLSQASGWLGWGTSAPKPRPAEEKVQLSANLPMSTNIPDVRRSIVSLTGSPLGNLAAAVDEFGRVLLLDCEELVIKRMWKGYREAQCGWLLVPEATPLPATPTRGRKRESSSKSKPERVKKAQCLCIYSPRRGIVELWPVLFGGRIAAFQVGKGCRLLYSPHGVFTSGASSQLDKEGGSGVRDTAVLLCPDGQLVSFSVPFASLVSLSDPSSHDNHLLKKLSEALSKGDSGTVLHVFSSIKSAQAMKQAVDILINAHPHRDVPMDFIVKCLKRALSRMDTSEPALRSLLHYVSGVRQLVQLSLALEGVVCDTKPHPFPAKLEQLLSNSCGLPVEQAKRTSAILDTYFARFKPQKRVIKKLEIRDLIKCVDLPRKVGNFILSSSAEKQTSVPSQTPLLLKDNLSEANLLDIGSSIFMPLITMDIAEHDVTSLIQKCGMPAKTLLSLLCRVFLSASYAECNVGVLLLHLEKAIAAITKLHTPAEGGEEDAPLWSDIGLQCSHTHCVGHALLLALLTSQTHSASSKHISGDTGEEESWETISADRETWIRLLHSLEALTNLSNVIGQSAMKLLPPAPWLAEDVRGVRGEGGGGVEVMDISDVQIQLMSETHKSGVCAASLGLFGPGLIANCLAQWLVPQAIQLPAEFIACMPTDPHQVSDGGRTKLVFQLSPLLRLLPRSLSRDSLLLCCAWHAGVKVHGSAQMLEYLSHLTSPQLLTGASCFFWHQLFEGTVIKVIDSLKRGSRVESSSAEAVSVCRNLFGYVYQLAATAKHQATEADCSVQNTISDVLTIDKPPGMHDLIDIVLAFPGLSPTIVKLYFELLLLVELALKLQTPVNVVVFFSTWLRGALKKGVFQCSSPRQEQVATQLQQKRAKFLCGSVSVYLEDSGHCSGPRMVKTVSSAVVSRLATAATPPAEVVEFEDFVFLLAELWGVDGDGVRKQWTASFFAAGLGEQGKEVFQGVKDKRRVSHELLAVGGCLADHLIHGVQSKPDRLALLAQTPPSLLEWLRKQGAGSVARGFQKMEPSWESLSQLMALTQPYLSGSPADTTMASELSKLISIRIQ